MRLSKFYILAAIVGLTAIVSAKIEPVMAAPINNRKPPVMSAPVDAMTLRSSGRELGSFNRGAKATMSRAADNKADLVIINRGVWEFYSLPGFKGNSLRLIKGSYPLNRLNFTNQISSFRRVR